MGKWSTDDDVDWRAAELEKIEWISMIFNGGFWYICSY